MPAIRSRSPLSLLVCSTLLAASVCGQTIVNTITHTGSFAGGVAYDSVTDEVLVVDSNTATVTFYDRASGFQTGQFALPTSLTAVGGAVDITTGNIWVVGESEDVIEFDRTGNQLSTFSTLPTIADASAIALDPTMNTIWVSDDSSNEVAEFTRAGVPTGSMISPPGSTDGDGLAYDPYSRMFLLGEDTLNAILVVDRNGAVQQTLSMSALGISPEGVAIDGATGNVFLANGLISPVAVMEVSGILQPTPAGAMTRYGVPCGARFAVDHPLRDDGSSNSGTWIGYQGALPPGSPYLLVGGFSQVAIPLAGVIPSPCTAYALTTGFSIFGLTNGNGRAGLRLPVVPGLSGFQVNLWGADFDVVNFGIPSSSDGIELIVQ